MKYCTPKLIFFFQLLHAVLAHQKLLVKNERVLIVDGSFNVSYFSCLLSVKNSLLILFPEVFSQLICGSTRQNKYLFISKSGKPLETRLLIIRALNPRPGEYLKTYEKLAKKGFRIQDFCINHFILNLIPMVFSLYDTFDGNEGLLNQGLLH